MCAAADRDNKATIVTLFSDRFRRTLRRALGSIEIIHIPERGIWTSVGLSREQFFAILLVSILLFLFLDGPAWRHLRDSHTARIAGSYGIIPVLVAFAQWRRGCLRLRSWAEASVLISLIKFLATAVLLVILALLL
jgi:hypothetical protein